MTPYEIKTKDVPPQRAAILRDTIATYGRVRDLFTELHETLALHGLTPGGPQLAIYFDKEYQPSDVDVAVAVPVAAGELPPDGRVHIDELPGGQMVSLLRQGSFSSDFRPAYQAIMAWVQDNGYRIAGPNREIWIRGPGSGVPAADFLLEIQFPVQKA